MIPSILKDKRIDLNLTPQDLFLTTELPIQKDACELKTWFASQSPNTAIPIIDVWRGQCSLAWMIFDETGSSCRVERSSFDDQTRLGISDDVLLDAVQDFGGSLSKTGQYPINSRIRYKLAELL